MAFKKLLLLIIIVGAFYQVSAQRKQNVYFYGKNNKEVTNKDSINFIRVIQEPDSGSVYYNLMEFYPDGQKKVLGSLSAFSPRFIYEDQLIFYYPSGGKQRVAQYKNNELVGPVYYYFENGLQSKTVEVKTSIIKETKPHTFKIDTLVMYQADSTGRVLVENGNGHSVEQISSFKGALVEGNYKNGFKHGTWTMKSNDGIYSYKEEYAAGQLISGESEMRGIKSYYTTMDKLPTMEGGLKKFYDYLNKTIKYPSDAKRNGIEGKVFLSFFVEVDGSLTNIKIDRGIYPSIDTEALRVLQASPKWVPALINRFPIRLKYNIPISFSLEKPQPIFGPDNNFTNPGHF